MTDREFLWWRIQSWFFHLWGVHSWVPLEDWHISENGVEVEIIGYVCWRCPAKKGIDDRE